VSNNALAVVSASPSASTAAPSSSGVVVYTSKFVGSDGVTHTTLATATSVVGATATGSGASATAAASKSASASGSAATGAAAAGQEMSGALVGGFMMLAGLLAAF
jgi:hypothetical protein